MMQTLAVLCLFLSHSPTPLIDARAAMENRDFLTAVEKYRIALQNDPRSYEAQFGLARALSFSGRYLEAIDEYSKLIEENPNDGDSRLGRGRAYAWSKQYEDALRDIRFVVEKTPDYADAWEALGDVYRWQENLSQAEESYSRCLSLQSNNPAALLGRARVYLQMGRKTEAQADVDSAEANQGDAKEIQELRDALQPPKPEEKPVVEEKSAVDARPFREGREIQYPWELRHSFDYLDFAPTDNEWLTHHTVLRREFPHGSIAIESLETKRFSEWDDAIAVDGYFDLWSGAYANLRLQGTPNADVLASWDGYAELFQGFGDGWETSGSYRHLDFSDNNVDLYGIGLGKYIGDWYLREKTTMTTESGSLDVSQSFTIRKFFVSEDHFLQFMTGFGDEVVTIGANQWVETRSTHFFSVGGQTYLTSHLGTFLNLNYQDIEKAPVRRGFELGFMIRW